MNNIPVNYIFKSLGSIERAFAHQNAFNRFIKIYALAATAALITTARSVGKLETRISKLESAMYEKSFCEDQTKEG